MIENKDKDYLNFGYYLTGEIIRTERKLIEFKKLGGGSEVDFGLFLVGDDSFVKKEFILWSCS